MGSSCADAPAGHEPPFLMVIGGRGKAKDVDRAYDGWVNPDVNRKRALLDAWLYMDACIQPWPRTVLTRTAAGPRPSCRTCRSSRPAKT